MKTLLVDFDGCVFDPTPNLVKLLKSERGIKVEPNNPSWSMGVSQEIISDIFTHEDIYSTTKEEMEECRNALLHAKHLGFKVILFSKVTCGNAIVKIDFINEYLLDVIDDFMLVSLGIDKTKFDMSDCVFIEDSPNNFGNCKYQVLSLIGGVKDWNEHYSVDSGYVMDTWEDFKWIIRHIDTDISKTK